MKTIKILSVIVVAVVLLGNMCFAQGSDAERKANKKLNRRVQTKNYTNQSYPPTEYVEIYRTDKPKRPYTEIAQIETDASYKNAMEYLTDKAKQLGGDAIIVVGEENRGVIAISLPEGSGVVASPINYLVAIVIKFKKQ